MGVIFSPKDQKDEYISEARKTIKIYQELKNKESFGSKVEMLERQDGKKLRLSITDIVDMIDEIENVISP